MREINFPEKDLPLRNDVRVLGGLVGEVLAEQHGDEFLQLVEAVRRAAINRREHKTGAEDELKQLLTGKDVESIDRLVRAFSVYFQVVNLAEKVHRIRRRRDYLRRGEIAQPGGLLATMQELNSFSRDELNGALLELRIEPVMTAHPTEATRRSLLEKEQFILRRLVERLDPSRTPEEEAAALARIKAAISTTWQTELYPITRMSVRNEMENVLFYLTDVLYPIVPPFYESLHSALESTGKLPEQVELPDLLRFGSWVGGDMDGNPNVNAGTIRQSLEYHRKEIINCYLPEVRSLARFLSQSLSEITVSGALASQLRKYMQLMPQVAEIIPQRHQQMPYRCLLILIGERLGGVLDGSGSAYTATTEFAADLQLLAESLQANRGQHAGLFAVRRLQQRERTFGFHLTTLDIRQDALVHRQVVGQVLGVPDWEQLDADTRADTLTQHLQADELPGFSETEEIKATLDIFRTIAWGQQTFGSRALGPFIISMTQGADDVLTILLLARLAGMQEANGAIPVDVAPLLETVDDLQHGESILQRLFQDSVYKQHLLSRSQRQIVMIGYSDSNKDGGIVSARWALATAQRKLSKLAAVYAVNLGFFHGRGGTVSRGGGNNAASILGAPRNTVNGFLRVTEQGEVINQKYGNRALAQRNLELMTSATLKTSLLPASEPKASWQQVMTTMASTSKLAYRQLVFDEPDFIDYFRHATPIDVIERMAIGSRPASRRSGGGVDSLRAIPWVFSWAQCRIGLPAIYGLGTALKQAVDEFGIEVLREMQSEWLLFDNLLSDVEMVLAKTDLAIGKQYRCLAPQSSHRVFPIIADEITTARNILLEVKQQSELLENSPTLQRSIRLRNPYVDPMSLLQIDLLHRWRATKCQDEELLEALLTTVNGIARGLQSTG